MIPGHGNQMSEASPKWMTRHSLYASEPGMMPDYYCYHYDGSIPIRQNLQDVCLDVDRKKDGKNSKIFGECSI
jgi:hypothetical protein